MNTAKIATLTFIPVIGAEAGFPKLPIFRGNVFVRVAPRMPVVARGVMKRSGILRPLTVRTFVRVALKTRSNASDVILAFLSFLPLTASTFVRVARTMRRNSKIAANPTLTIDHYSIRGANYVNIA